MTKYKQLSLVFALSILGAGAAQAACEGNLGRGWARGAGNGSYAMKAADKVCNIGFANFYAEGSNRATPATEVKLTQAPKNGKIGIRAGQGIVYTPNAGFKGSDKFCTSNTAKGQSGKLSGCITVTVQ